MSNYANLKSAIQEVIKTNGRNEITGQLLQTELLAMINTLGYGYQFMGIANPDTVPGTPDAKVFYIAYTPGTYTNFNGISVTGLCVLKYATGWVKEDIPVGGGGTDIAVEPTDLTLVSGDPNKLKFADRLRESNITTGKNYIILRENATFAQQVTIANAIYEIRYDFDLNNASFDIPSGCVLKFVGGKLTNGTLVGQNTAIDADIVQIFGTDITLSGSWNLVNAYPEWFGAVADGTTDCTIAIQKLDGFPIKFSGGTYIISNVILHARTLLIGSGIEKTILKQKANSVDDLIILQDWYGGCMRDLTVKGDATATLSGNGFQTALVKLRSEKRTPNNTFNYYASIDNVFIGGVGDANRFNGLSLLGNNEVDNGFTCASNWVFHISNIWIRSVGGYGIYDASTDNLFNTLDIGSCGYAHIYEKGSSNMWVSAKLDGNIYQIDGTAEEIFNMEDKGALLIINSGGVVHMKNFDLQDCRYCGVKIINCPDSDLEISSNTIGSSTQVSDIAYSKNCYIKTLVRSTLKLYIVPYTNQVSTIAINRFNSVYQNVITILGNILEDDKEVVKVLMGNNNVDVSNCISIAARRDKIAPLTNTMILQNIFLKSIVEDTDQTYFGYNQITRETADPIYANSPYVLFDNSATQILRQLTKPYPAKQIRKDAFYIAAAIIRIDKVPTGSGDIYPYINVQISGISPSISAAKRTRNSTPSVGDVYVETYIFSFSMNTNIVNEFNGLGIGLYLAAASNGKFSVGNFCLYEITDLDFKYLYDYETLTTVAQNAPYTTDLIVKFKGNKNINSFTMDSVSRESLYANANRYNRGRLVFDSTFKELAYYDGAEWVSGSTGLKLAKRSGAFTAKPTFTAGTNAGFLYFDTTNNKYIVWNGTAWTNVDGSALSQ